MASWLAANLTKEGHSVALLSGELTVMQRASIIERFRDGKEKVLVTTNVCSRGKRQKSSAKLCCNFCGAGFRLTFDG